MEDDGTWFPNVCALFSFFRTGEKQNKQRKKRQEKTISKERDEEKK
jgi:hypothetical protein